MAIDSRFDIEDRLRHLDAKLDRVLDLLSRVAEDVDHSTALRDNNAGVAELRADLNRGFADLRNAVRHFGVRLGEGDRYRGR
jgi:hypothetical protein